MKTRMKVMFKYVYNTPNYEDTYGYGTSTRMYESETAARNAFEQWRNNNQNRVNNIDWSKHLWTIEDTWPNWVGVVPVYFMEEYEDKK